MTSPMYKAMTSARMARALGPRKFAARAVQTARLQGGSLQRDLPLKSWDECPLGTTLIDPALAEPDVYREYRREDGPRFFFDPISRSGARGRFSSWDEHTSPIAVADEVLNGTIRYFSRTPASLGDPPDWHRDPFACESWPADVHFADIELNHGDIRVIWEASRFGYAFPWFAPFGDPVMNGTPKGFGNFSNSGVSPIRQTGD